MGRKVAVAHFVVAMVAVIVGADLVFFRNRFWERLTVNIGIVLVFAAFYWRFLRPWTRKKLERRTPVVRRA
jgi:membrane protein implicated in regulation of membrane protease activity